VFSRWRVSQTELYTNPGDPKFNTPERYTITPINGQPFRIHESRILRADGVPTPERAQLQSLGWGDSVLTALWTALKNVGSADGYSIGILRDFVQGVMQIENLAQLIGAGRETDLITRLNLIDMSRSILNTIILDKTENYSRISASVAGLPELLDRHREALAAAAEMPVTLLFGRSPSGLSTDDRSGERNWYDKIAGEQEGGSDRRQGARGLEALVLPALPSRREGRSGDSEVPHGDGDWVHRCRCP
jgi:phage-related protein (TIGR01555 family)